MNYDNDVYSKLITAYKNTRILIARDTNNKNNIIKEYIDLVLKFTSKPQQSFNNNNNNNNKIPDSQDISIYNNFNAIPNNYVNNKMTGVNKVVDITKTSDRSIQELASTFNYMN